MVAAIPAQIKAPSPSTRRSAPPPTNTPLTAYHPPLRPLCLPAQAGSSLRVRCVALFSDLGQTCQLPCLHRFAASLHSFLHSFPLFSTACSLFSENTRGGGYRDPILEFFSGVGDAPKTELPRRAGCRRGPNSLGH